MRTCVEDTSCSGDCTATRRGATPDSTRGSVGLRPIRIGTSSSRMSPGTTRTANRCGGGTTSAPPAGVGIAPGTGGRPIPGVSRRSGRSVAAPGSSMSIAPGSSCATGTGCATGAASGDSASPAVAGTSGSSACENRLELRLRERMIVSSSSDSGTPATASSAGCGLRSAVRSTRSSGVLDQVSSSPSTTPSPIGREPIESRATDPVGRSSPPIASPVTLRNSASTQGWTPPDPNRRAPPTE